jgi:Ca-activated chloride channel homolog
MSWLPADLVENFHFLRPVLLYALLPALIFAFLLRLAQTNQNSWVRAIDARLLPYLLDKNGLSAQSLPLYGLLALWIVSVLALAGPVWQQVPVPVQEREDALVIVLDMSMSMYATDLSPNRAVRAQRKVIDILEYRRQEGQTGLVVYAGDAHAVTPMTDDIETIKNLVTSVQPNIMPIAGSNPSAGVALGLTLLANSNLAAARILLLTDGIQSSDITAITSLLDGSKHTLSVIGFGTDAGSPVSMGQQGYLRDDKGAIVIPRLEREPLQQLAAATSGLYTDAQLTDTDVLALLNQAPLSQLDEGLKAVEDREFDAWYETGPWLLLLVIPLAALAFRRGWLFLLVFGVFALPAQPSYAWEWRDMWQRKDQQGSQSFNQQAYADAATQFQDPAWRAAANYRHGDWQAVVENLSTRTDPESHYNRGNALAHVMQYEAAIAAYEQTLAQVPDHADALHNKALVEKLLEQKQKDQQQEEQQQQQGEQDQQDQQQNQQDQQSQQDQQNQNQNQDQQNQQQQNQDQQQDEQDKQQQDQQEQDKQDQNENKDEQQSENQQANNSDKPSEEDQAMQQWLMRIPDDPGELLRNKFRYQAQQEAFEQLQNPGQPPKNKQSW